LRTSLLSCVFGAQRVRRSSPSADNVATFGEIGLTVEDAGVRLLPKARVFEPY
jgi:hypothetical protein